MNKEEAQTVLNKAVQGWEATINEWMGRNQDVVQALGLITPTIKVKTQRKPPRWGPVGLAKHNMVDPGYDEAEVQAVLEQLKPRSKLHTLLTNILHRPELVTMSGSSAETLISYNTQLARKGSNLRFIAIDPYAKPKDRTYELGTLKTED
jgi:hypothetical protein